MTTIPLCATCRFAFTPTRGTPPTCRAFPTGIPDAILMSEVDHHFPYPGDHGIQYQHGAPTNPGMTAKPAITLLKRLAQSLHRGHERRSRPERYAKSGGNCGDGSGGFQAGNRCAKGGGGTATAEAPSRGRQPPVGGSPRSATATVPPPKGKPPAMAPAKGVRAAAAAVPPDEDPRAPGLTVHQSRKRIADNIEKTFARILPGGVWIPGNAPSDVRLPKKGGGFDEIEVKSKTYGGKKSLSVHPGALYDKVKAANEHSENDWHTVLIDGRNISEGGAWAGNYSGHTLYYKRAAGAYGITNMYPAKDVAELKRLIAMPYEQLPPLARGEFPKGRELAELKIKAARDRAYNNERSRLTKAEHKAKGGSVYKPRGAIIGQSPNVTATVSSGKPGPTRLRSK